MIDIITSYISTNYIDTVAALIGLLYLYLEFKASIWMWLVSIVMALFFVYIFYNSQLYASMVIYIYFFFASIYGWIAWTKENRDQTTGSHILLRLPVKKVPYILILVIFTFILIIILLYYFTQNKLTIQLGDALTTALNIVALWMAARKWAEQWCLLIPANLLSAGLLILQGQPASAILFFIYFVVSIFGYLNWKKIADKKAF